MNKTNEDVASPFYSEDEAKKRISCTVEGDMYFYGGCSDSVIAECRGKSVLSIVTRFFVETGLSKRDILSTFREAGVRLQWDYRTETFDIAANEPREETDYEQYARVAVVLANRRISQLTDSLTAMSEVLSAIVFGAFRGHAHAQNEER